MKIKRYSQFITKSQIHFKLMSIYSSTAEQKKRSFAYFIEIQRKFQNQMHKIKIVSLNHSVFPFTKFKDGFFIKRYDSFLSNSHYREKRNSRTFIDSFWKSL